MVMPPQGMVSLKQETNQHLLRCFVRAALSFRVMRLIKEKNLSVSVPLWRKKIIATKTPSHKV